MIIDYLGVRGDISPPTIGQFLYRRDYQPMVNSKIDYQLEEIRKVTNKPMGLKEKICFFGLIAEIIA